MITSSADCLISATMRRCPFAPHHRTSRFALLKRPLFPLRSTSRSQSVFRRCVCYAVLYMANRNRAISLFPVCLFGAIACAVLHEFFLPFVLKHNSSKSGFLSCWHSSSRFFFPFVCHISLDVVTQSIFVLWFLFALFYQPALSSWHRAPCSLLALFPRRLFSWLFETFLHRSSFLSAPKRPPDRPSRSISPLFSIHQRILVSWPVGGA